MENIFCWEPMPLPDWSLIFTPPKPRPPRTVRQYLSTFRRMPDDVVLDLCTRKLQMDEPHRCVCGWALRAEIGRLSNRDPRYVRLDVDDETKECAKRFGGSVKEWEAIFLGVTQPVELVKIETALVRRLCEVVGDVTTNVKAADALLAEVSASACEAPQLEAV